MYFLLVHEFENAESTFWAKRSLFFCIKILTSVVAQKRYFLQQKPESGSFWSETQSPELSGGAKHSFYTKVVFGDKYLYYLYFISAGLCGVAKCKKKKGERMKMVQNNNLRKIERKTFNILWQISFPFVISNNWQPLLF